MQQQKNSPPCCSLVCEQLARALVLFILFLFFYKQNEVRTLCSKIGLRALKSPPRPFAHSRSLVAATTHADGLRRCHQHNFHVGTRQRQAATGPLFSFGGPPSAAAGFGASPAPARASAGGCGTFGVNPAQSPGGGFGSAGGESGESGLIEGFHYPAQPPPQPVLPPDAKVAMAQVEGGDCGTGSVSFAIGNPATVRCRREGN